MNPMILQLPTPPSKTLQRNFKRRVVSHVDKDNRPSTMHCYDQYATRLTMENSHPSNSRKRTLKCNDVPCKVQDTFLSQPCQLNVDNLSRENDKYDYLLDSTLSSDMLRAIAYRILFSQSPVIMF